MKDSEIISNFVCNIKNSLKKQIDIEYTEYEISCLENLKYILESKRNEIVKSILDGIDISLCTDARSIFEPIIQIKITNKGGD